MTKEQIINEIVNTGFFVYTPSRWSEQMDNLLTECESECLIRQATQKEFSINWEYIYVRQEKALAGLRNS